MAAVGNVPQELLIKPLGFVAVTGLDIVHNAIHSAIWDAFNASRRQEKALNIKPVAGDYECPRRRQKRTSYEFYVPKGILKKDWMGKHLHIIPSLMVIFFDLDWDDNQWKEKETECASRVAVLRSSLQGRNTKLAVVLIQKNIPLPPGEDVQAGERAISLCSACGLSAKSLFVLPFSDHLHGYVTRLENAFYEISQGYYTNEIRRVKAHREYLNKSQHQLLYIRHQFKIGFFCELKQDVHSALKHYKQAYLHILEIKLTDVNNLEVKTVAGFINYKVSAPLDAISQFRKHIDFFKTKPGITDLVFEHSEWMGKQFSLFGDLFQEAVKEGLQAIQTQHPGFYYQQAAVHSVARRKECSKLCKFSQPIKPDPLEKAEYLEYFGQRPWRQGCQANEPPDPAMEQAGIMSLQAKELTVDHSGIIIPLLSSAVAQFREYKSVRLTLSLMVQMGEECYHAKDYTKALTLLNRVTVYYRSERWWALLTFILVTGLRCSFFTGNVQEYVTFALELCSQHSEVEIDEKRRIMENLLKIVHGDPPEPETLEENQSLDEAETWGGNGSGEYLFTVQMDTLASFIECRAAFDEDTFHADEQVTLRIYLRNKVEAEILSFAFRMHVFNWNPRRNDTMKLKLHLKENVFHALVKEGNQDCWLYELLIKFLAYNQLYFQSLDESSSDERQNTSLILYPDKVKFVSFSFVPLLADISSKLEVKQIRLNLGDNVALRWDSAGIDSNCQGIDFQNFGNGRLPVSCNRAGEILWESVQMHPVTELIPRDCQISLNFIHDPPLYVGEFYQVNIEVVNKEKFEINNVCINVHLKFDGEEQRSSRVFKSVPNRDEIPNDNLEVSFDVGKLAPEEKTSALFFVNSLQECEEQLVAKVSYDITVLCGESGKDVMCKCTKEESLMVKVMSPLSVGYRFHNMQFEVIEKVNAEEPFLFFCKIGSAPRWPILIKSTHFELGGKVSFKDGSHKGHLADTEISEGNEAAEGHCLVTSGISSQSEEIPFGNYVIEWKRTDADMSIPSVVTKVPLPNVVVAEVPIYIETRLPSCGCVQQALPVSYKIYNRTDMVQEVEVEIEPSDAFMFSGNSQVQFRILPHDFHVLNYNMYPRTSGNVNIPKLHISLPRYLSKSVDTMAQKMLPTSIFVTTKCVVISNKCSYSCLWQNDKSFTWMRLPMKVNAVEGLVA